MSGASGALLVALMCALAAPGALAAFRRYDTLLLNMDKSPSGSTARSGIVFVYYDPRTNTSAFTARFDMLRSESGTLTITPPNATGSWTIPAQTVGGSVSSEVYGEFVGSPLGAVFMLQVNFAGSAGQGTFRAIIPADQTPSIDSSVSANDLIQITSFQGAFGELLLVQSQLYSNGSHNLMRLSYIDSGLPFQASNVAIRLQYNPLSANAMWVSGSSTSTTTATTVVWNVTLNYQPRTTYIVPIPIGAVCAYSSGRLATSLYYTLGTAPRFVPSAIDYLTSGIAGSSYPLSPRNTGNPAASGGVFTVYPIGSDPASGIWLTIGIYAYNVTAGTRCSVLDSKNVPRITLSNAVADPKVPTAYSFASNSSIPFNSSLIANGELFEDVTVACYTGTDPNRDAVRSLMASLDEEFQLPLPSQWNVIALVSGTGTSLPRPGVVMVGTANPAMGFFSFSFLYPRTTLSKQLANGTRIAIVSNQPGVGLQDLVVSPTGISFFSGAAPAAALLNVVGTQLEVRRGSAVVARGQINSAPARVDAMVVPTTAAPVTTNSASATTDFRVVLDMSSIQRALNSNINAGFARLNWDTSVPGRIRLYYRIQFQVDTTPALMYLYQRSPVGDRPVGLAQLNYELSGHTEGYLELQDSSLLMAMRAGSIRVEVADNRNVRIVGGDVVPDIQAPSLASAYTDSVIAISASVTSPYACVTRGGYNLVADLMAVVIHCSPNATFTSATMQLALRNGSVYPIYTVSAANRVTGGWGLQAVYPKFPLDNVFEGSTFSVVTLGALGSSSPPLSGKFYSDKRILDANLVGLSINNRQTAAAGYAVLEHHAANYLSLTAFISGLRTDITQAVISSPSGWSMSFTEKIDDGIALVSFNWPYFKFIAELLTGQISVNISTTDFPNGNVYGNLWQRPIPGLIFNSKPLEFSSSLSGQLASPVNPVVAGIGGSASFFVLAPPNGPSDDVVYFDVLGRINMASLTQASPPALLQSMTVYGDLGTGTQTPIVSFSQVTGNGGFQMFNLTADQINSLSYGSVSADTFTSKPVARGLVFTKPIVSYAIMGGYGASRTSTAAAFGSLLLDHFGMLHYTVRQAGFSSNIKTTLVRSLPSKAVDTEITSDFSGPLGYNEVRPSPNYLLRMLNKKSYVATATQASGASDEISGIIQPSLSDGAPNAMLVTALAPASSSRSAGAAHVVFYPTFLGLTVIMAPGDFVPMFISLGDASGNVYARVPYYGDGFLDESTYQWYPITVNDTVKDWMTSGQIWVNGLDMNNNTVIRGLLQIKPQAFEVLLSPTTAGSAAGVVQFRLDQWGGLSYTARITGLTGLSANPTIRFDAGQVGSQLFATLPDITLTEQRHGTYEATGRLDIVDYSATTSRWQFYQLYSNTRCSVYSSSAIVLRGPVTPISFDDTGESVDLSTIMSGSQVTGTPAVGLAAGSGDFEFQSDSKLHFHLEVVGMSSPITKAYIGGSAVRGKDGVLQFDLMPYLNGYVFHGFVASFNYSNFRELIAGHYYVVVATVNNPNGELRGQIQVNPQIYSDIMRPTTTFNAGGTVRFQLDGFGMIQFDMALDLGASLAVTNSPYTTLQLTVPQSGLPNGLTILVLDSFINHQGELRGSFPASPLLLYALGHRRLTARLSSCLSCTAFLTGTPVTFTPAFVKLRPPVYYYSLMTGSHLVGTGANTRMVGFSYFALDTAGNLYYYMQLYSVTNTVQTISFRNGSQVVQYTVPQANYDIGSGWVAGVFMGLTTDQQSQLNSGTWYVLVATQTIPLGELVGLIVLTTQSRTAVLAPGSANPTGGAALAKLIVNHGGDIAVKYSIRGLSGPLTQANMADQQTTNVGASMLNSIIEHQSVAMFYQQSASWYPLASRGQLQMRLGTQANTGGELNGFFQPDLTAQDVEYNVLLTGFDVATADSARSAAKTSASGRGSFFFDGISIRYYVTISGLSGPPTAIDLYLGAGKGFLSQWNSSFSFMDTFDGVLASGLITSPSEDMLTFIGNGSAYILVTTSNFPMGELRGNIELEFRSVEILVTQSGSALTSSSAAPTGKSVGIQCYAVADGLYCVVYPSDSSVNMTSMRIVDINNNTVSDVFGTYTYLGNWFFTFLSMRNTTAMYNGNLYVLIGTSRNPSGELSGRIVVDRNQFSDYYNSRYHGLIGNSASRAAGFISLVRAYDRVYNYKGGIQGGLATSCMLRNPTTSVKIADLSVNGYAIFGTVTLPVAIFSASMQMRCTLSDGTVLSGDVVLEREDFIGILTGGGVTSDPKAQISTSASIVSLSTTTNNQLEYVGRTWGVSAASFASESLVFSDGPQFFTANSTGMDGSQSLGASFRTDELYATNSYLQISSQTNSGLPPVLLRGSPFPAASSQDLLRYLRGKPLLSGQLNLALTPNGIPSSLTADYQGHGGLLQIRYTRSLRLMYLSVTLAGLANNLQRVGFWDSTSGRQIIDLLPLVGTGVFRGQVRVDVQLKITPQQLNLFKENNVYFRADSVAFNKNLGKVGSVVFNNMVTAPQSPWYAAGSVKEGDINAYVLDITDTFTFPAPSKLTYKITSGATLNGFSVFVAGSDGVLYTGANSSMVPDYETAQTMLVVVQEFISGTFYATINLVVTIIDVNDNFPMFTSAPNATVLEDNTQTPNPSPLVTVTVSDRDSPRYGAPIVRILSATNANGDDRTSLFAVRQPSPGGPAQIVRAAVLDRDTPGNTWFKINLQAIDGTPAVMDRKTTNTTLYITLIDVNDNAPKFAQSFYTALPEETLAVGAVVLRITATDADSTTNQQLSYTLRPTDSSPPADFAVATVVQDGAYVAMVRVNRQLDFETREQYNLSLTATDQGRPQMASSVPIYITVVNQPFKLVINYPPPFLTVSNGSFVTGNYANNNRANFSFASNLEDGITMVAFQCRVLTQRAACRYNRTSVGACSTTCGNGVRSVSLRRVTQAVPTDPTCADKNIVEQCQVQPCVNPKQAQVISGPSNSRKRRQASGIIPCGKDLYCEQLDLSNLASNPFVPCTMNGAAISQRGTFAQMNPADGDYVFQLRANITIQKQTETFVGFTNTTLTYTIDTTPPVTTLTQTPQNPNNVTCPSFEFTNNDIVNYWCKLEYVGTTRNFTRCTSPFNPCQQPASNGYGALWRNGLYKFSVFSVDRATNQEAFQKTYTYEFDSFRPLVGLVDFPPRINTGLRQRFEYITNDSLATVTCKLNGAGVACPAGGFMLTGSQGENHFTMEAKDPAGNYAPFVDYLYFIDTRAPQVEVADLTDGVFKNKQNYAVHFQTNEELFDMRCRIRPWPVGNNTAYFDECCDQVYSSQIAQEKNCLAACKDYSNAAKLEQETVCRLLLRAYSQCLENKTREFRNSVVMGSSLLPCEADSLYVPSCRNGTYSLQQARPPGFYLYQTKYRDLNGNQQCYQGSFAYDPRYITAERDADDPNVKLQTCPSDNLAYIIFMACAAGLFVIALLIFTCYLCKVRTKDPYHKPVAVGPSTANLGKATFIAGREELQLDVGQQEMFDDKRYAGVEHSDDKTNLADAMEVEDMYESLEVN